MYAKVVTHGSLKPEAEGLPKVGRDKINIVKALTKILTLLFFTHFIILHILQNM
jgi:hypothetical protein